MLTVTYIILYFVPLMILVEFHVALLCVAAYAFAELIDNSLAATAQNETTRDIEIRLVSVVVLILSDQCCDGHFLGNTLYRAIEQHLNNR